METIGLIAAMPQESKALLRCIQVWQPAALGDFRGARFRLLERECWLVTTGMGLQRAMQGTRALLSATHPQLLVSFGIAGAVNADLHIGDVVAAAHTCRLEVGSPGPSVPLASLSTAAWQAAADALKPEGARLVMGTAVTTRGSQLVPQSLKELPHPVLEMETAWIAQIAAELGIPLLSIRSISDGPLAPIPFDLEAVMDENDNLRMGRLLGMVLRKPQIIFQFRRMMVNSRIAADNAAKAVVAALGQASAFITP